MPVNKEGVTILINQFNGGPGAHLTFSVVAFHEPDIQLVDHILAVGDPVSRRACLDNKLAGLLSQKSLSSCAHIVRTSKFLSDRDRWADVLILRGRLVRSC
jgi:ABC-type polysaccharide/polyol phosphate transport system ATPase subunit